MIRISLFLLAATLALAACPKGSKDEHDHASGAHDHTKAEHGHAVDEHGHGKGEHAQDAKTPTPPKSEAAASPTADGGTR